MIRYAVIKQFYKILLNRKRGKLCLKLDHREPSKILFKKLIWILWSNEFYNIILLNLYIKFKFLLNL